MDKDIRNFFKVTPQKEIKLKSTDKEKKTEKTIQNETFKKKRTAYELDQLDQEHSIELNNQNSNDSKLQVDPNKKTNQASMLTNVQEKSAKKKKSKHLNKLDPAYSLKVKNPLPPIDEISEKSNFKYIKRSHKIIDDEMEVDSINNTKLNAINDCQSKNLDQNKTGNKNSESLENKVNSIVTLKPIEQINPDSNKKKEKIKVDPINFFNKKISKPVEINTHKVNQVDATNTLFKSVNPNTLDIPNQKIHVVETISNNESKCKEIEFDIDELDLESIVQDMFTEETTIEVKKDQTFNLVDSNVILNNRSIIKNPSISNNFEKIIQSNCSNLINSEENSNHSISSNNSHKNYNFNYSKLKKNLNDIPVQKETKNEKCEIKSQQINNQLWTSKYCPNSLDSIIGNVQIIKKLKNWLESWDDVHLRGIKHEIDYSNSTRGKSKIENINARGCMISGSPGVGKTSSVRILGSHLGFKTFELNASDQRNKQIIMSKVGYLMDNTTITTSNISQKNLIIMDEVDGMAGTEDKGGISALIEIVKKTKIPIICICNDVGNQKLRSLINHCYDLKFSRPEKNLVIQRLKEICLAENLKIENTSLENLYDNTGGDIRQCLNFLEMQSRRQNYLNSVQFKENLKKGSKDSDLMLNPFDACKRMLNKQEFRPLSYHAKLDLFFVDFDLIPNLIHENYLTAFSNRRGLAELQRLVKSADNISLGDIIEKRMRTNNEWNLLPNRGFCSSVAPAFYSNGFVSFTKFPESFSKFSKLRKILRQSKELKTLFPYQSIRTIKEEVVPILFLKILNSLIEKGKDSVEQILNILQEHKFNLLMFKENLFDLTPQRLSFKYEKLNSTIKAHLTKKLNEEFKTSVVKKKKKDKDLESLSKKRDFEGNIVDDADLSSEDDSLFEIELKETKSNKKTKNKASSKN